MERAWCVKNNKGQEVICQCPSKPFDYLDTVLRREKFGFLPKNVYSNKDVIDYLGGWCNTYSPGHLSIPKLEGVIVPDGTFEKLGIDYKGEPVELTNDSGTSV